MTTKRMLLCSLLAIFFCFAAAPVFAAAPDKAKSPVNGMGKYFESPEYQTKVAAWGLVLFPEDLKKRQKRGKSLTPKERELVALYTIKHQTDQLAKRKAAGIDALTGRQIPGVKAPRASIIRNYKKAIEAAAAKHDVPENLIATVIDIESNGNPRAVSPKGAMGLMQLMPGTAADMGVKNPFDPHQNINGGTKYLRRMIDRYGSVNMALFAYCHGPKRADRKKAAGGFDPMSTKYVRSFYEGSAKPQNVAMVSKNGK